MDNYFEHPAINQSKLKDMKNTPLYFYHKHIAKTIIEKEKKSFNFGRALHLAILEPEKFIKNVVSFEKIDKRTKEGKIEHEKQQLFLNENLDKLILDNQEYQDLKVMLENAKNHELLQSLLFDAKFEMPFFWTDELTGIECKGLADVFIEPCEQFPNGYLIDLKSINSLKDWDIKNNFINFGYYNQVGWYCKGIQNVYQTQDLPLFSFIFIEKSLPFDIRVFTMEQDHIPFAIMENNQLLTKYKECLDTGIWHGYSQDDDNMLSIPNYLIEKIGANNE